MKHPYNLRAKRMNVHCIVHSAAREVRIHQSLARHREQKEEEKEMEPREKAPNRFRTSASRRVFAFIRIPSAKPGCPHN